MEGVVLLHKVLGAFTLNVERNYMLYNIMYTRVVEYYMSLSNPRKKVFNPFDTLRFGKIRLFERPNRGMLIRATHCHEFTSQEQVLKCGSAAATLGFQWH